MKTKIFPIALLIPLLFLCGCASTSNSNWPHVITETGDWKPEPGYSWVYPDSQSNLSVRWQPGKAYWHLGSVKWPHVIALTTEGSWGPEPGYSWVYPDSQSNLSVHWEQGKAYLYLGSVKWPHVVASSTEGSWCPESGYEWAHLDSAGHPIPGDYAVVSTSERRAARDQRNTMNDRWAKYLKEIQTDNAYPNWSGPPYDLYLKKQQK